MRRVVSTAGIGVTAAAAAYFVYSILRYAAPDVKIVFVYILYWIAAALLVYATHTWAMPQAGVYTCLAALSFGCQFLLSSQVFFIGEGDLKKLLSNAFQLAEGRFAFPNLYGATFPATVTYPAFLSGWMRVFGINSAVAVMLNHIGVCALVCSVYAFLRKRMPKPWAMGGALLMALHPFVLIYADTCNAEILFGVFTLFSFFSFAKAREAESARRRFLWTAGSALLCGFSGFFRPLAVVLMAAYVLWLWVFASGRGRDKLLLSAILLGVYLLCTLAHRVTVKTLTGYDPPSSGYGWNLYVGASETGQWNREDGEEFLRFMETAATPTDIQRHFAQKAFARYRDMGPVGWLLRIRKLAPWLSYGYIAEKVTTQGAGASFNLKDAQGAVRAITALVDIPVLFLALAGCFPVLRWSVRKAEDPMLILVLFWLGSVMLLLVMEVAPRYTVSYRLLFCILAASFVADRFGKLTR